MDEGRPEPPIWREDLQSIRELTTPEEFEALLKRLVHIEPVGPLHDFRVCPSLIKNHSKPRTPRRTPLNN